MKNIYTFKCCLLNLNKFHIFIVFFLSRKIHIPNVLCCTFKTYSLKTSVVLKTVTKYSFKGQLSFYANCFYNYNVFIKNVKK